jgi:hypothetical protein
MVSDFYDGGFSVLDRDACRGRISGSRWMKIRKRWRMFQGR